MTGAKERRVTDVKVRDADKKRRVTDVKVREADKKRRLADVKVRKTDEKWRARPLRSVTRTKVTLLTGVAVESWRFRTTERRLAVWQSGSGRCCVASPGSRLLP